MLLPVVEQALETAKQYRFLGDYAGGRRVLCEFLRQNESRLSPLDECAIDLAMGRLWQLQSRFIAAGQHYAEALDLARMCHSEFWQCKCEYAIAELLSVQKHHDRALALLDKVQALAERRGFERVLAKVYGLQGEISCMKGGLDDARQKISKSLELYRRAGDPEGIAEQLSNLGRVSVNSNNYPDGIRYFRQALEGYERLGYRDRQASQLNNLGGTYSNLGRSEEAIRLLRQALAIREQIGNYEGMANQQETIAYIHQYVLHQPLQAMEWYRGAISSLELVRNQIAGTAEQHEAYFEELAEVYQEQIELLCQQYQQDGQDAGLREIIGLIERAKANVLLARVAGTLRTDTLTTVASPQEREQIEARRKRIENLDIRIQQSLAARQLAKAAEFVGEKVRVQKALSELKLEIILRQGKVPELNREARDLLTDLRQKHLEANEVFLSYYLTLHHLYCVEMSKSGVGLHRLAGRAEFDRCLQQYLRKIREVVEWITDEDSLAAWRLPLWRLLTKDGQLMPDDQKHYLISPDAEIGLIPFESLPVPQQNTYVGLSFQITYQPSAVILARQRSEPERRYQIDFAGFARSEFRSPQLEELPHAQQEIEEILSRFSQNRGGRCFSTIATRENLISATRAPVRCLHFASHALLEYAAFGLKEPALVLGDRDGRKDDFLTASEIFEMNISAKLVILSACHSAAGRVIHGEGVHSLTRAFLGAGARCVVCSLREVVDEVAPHFMRHFYEHLNELTIAEALFEARRATRRKFPAPFQWSAFIVVGDANCHLWE